MANWRDWVDGAVRSYATFAGHYGERFTGFVIGLMSDLIAEGASQAVTNWWINSRKPPEDWLAFLGNERLLPRYPKETSLQYRQRILDAWNIWPFAGDENTIEQQLETMGFTEVQVLDAAEVPLLPPVGYWSQFWVYIAGGHSITGSGPTYGSFNWGDGTRYGPYGLNADEYAAVRGIIRKFKPTEWICREIVWQIEGWAYGTGHTWGEAGLVWGGSVARTGA